MSLQFATLAPPPLKVLLCREFFSAYPMISNRRTTVAPFGLTPPASFFISRFLLEVDSSLPQLRLPRLLLEIPCEYPHFPLNGLFFPPIFPFKDRLSPNFCCV